MASYDYPLNERIRTLLRVEDLFAKVFYHIEASHEQQHHVALLTLLQILDVIDRADFKLDILQELDRQKTTLRLLIGNPVIATDILSSTLASIESAAEALRSDPSKLGQILRTNEWLMSIKQRAGILGGICEFDVPSYHYWLGLGEARRKQDLQTWLAPLIPLQKAVVLLLRILRGSGASTELVAVNGVYQQMLFGTKPAQMLKIELDKKLSCFPEVSANKYAINIRFNTLDCTQKPQKHDETVNFTLTLCNF
ncbi:MAG: cell division protein ZapD [Methylotenera sp.]|nr:cell division protein ZapD [Methylotenera sp.]